MGSIYGPVSKGDRKKNLEVKEEFGLKKKKKNHPNK